MDTVANPTHIFKGQSVRLIELTYVNNGQQFCTIEKINRLGKLHRQTVQVRNLTEIKSRKEVSTGGEEKEVQVQEEKEIGIPGDTGRPYPPTWLEEQ